ncbi:MAG: hypothetical protein Q8Q12_02460 [bacterium]|nr:hypothetical protein [bacterium]
MVWSKPAFHTAFSLVMIPGVLTSSEGAAPSVEATGSTWVKPIKANVVVYTSTGTKVETIGVLDKDVIVQVLREDRDWYQVRFVRENAEFVGWVLKAEVAVEGTPPNPPVRNPKPDPAPKPEETKPQEQRLSLQETHGKLMEMIQIPVGTAPMFKKTWNRSRMQELVAESGSTGMQIFGGQKAKMDVLYLFDPDEVIEVFVEDKIRELKKLRSEGHPDFAWVIDCYIRALEAYIEGKFPDLRKLVAQAERFWRSIAAVTPDMEVGF